MKSCICSNKDKNFKANHNTNEALELVKDVVSVVTKIRILKQITTQNCRVSVKKSCICSNKDKNFKANHNSGMSFTKYTEVVSVVTKIRILKQITTAKSSL